MGSTTPIHRKIWNRLTLRTHRNNAAVFWPGLQDADLWLAAIWLAMLQFHDELLWLVCRYAHLLRRWRRKSVSGRPGHVLHVTGSFDLGGSQTQIKNLCLPQSSTTAFSHEAVEIFPEVNFLFRQGVAVDAARYMGHNLIGRTIGRLITFSGTRSSQIVQVFKLVKDFRVARPEVVVGWGHELCMVTFTAAAIARVPRVVFCVRTFNPGYGWVTPRMARLMRIGHSRMVPLVSRVIVNSTPLQQDYAAWLGIDPGSVSVCANGIDAVRIDSADAVSLRRRMRERYNIADDTIVLIHVGRFSAEKGQMSLMHANLALLERYPERKFVWLLCGDGSMMADVQAFAVSHSMDNVIFVGRTDQVRALLHAADIFVMPSDFEGMPNAMMEAMAQGLPSVSTDRSGAVDVARDGQEALYYRPRDIPHLVKHLSYLFDHEVERRQLGHRAQARMREFSVARSVAAFEALLSDDE